MPFVEMGSDTRALARAATRGGNNGIPRERPEQIGRGAAACAIYHGLARSEIAVNHSLSANTVKPRRNNYNNAQ